MVDTVNAVDFIARFFLIQILNFFEAIKLIFFRILQTLI